ncbi:MAG: hypothetical protein KKG14_04155 [Alphaproteobacteria bacterium]|nr:hypothetical protein [Alphaproteobacteria bacterium]MBU2417876.1 hypothetical protein [Alphaproteobacteria bacterium]
MVSVGGLGLGIASASHRVGVILDLPRTAIPPEVHTIRSSGFQVPGIGAATYVRQSAAPDGRRPAYTSADGSVFVLAEDQPTPAMFGALATADDTAALQDWAAAGGGRVPRADYRISRPVLLPSGFVGRTEAGAAFHWIGGAPAPGVYAGVFLAFRARDITFGGPRPWTVNSGTDQRSRWAVVIVSSRNVVIENLMAVGLNEVIASSAIRLSEDGYRVEDQTPYADVVINPAEPGFNGCAMIRVAGGGARFHQPTSGIQPSARAFYFCNGFLSDGGDFENVGHGVMWWGGDSAPDRDGALGNERKLAAGVIRDARVHNAAGAFVWGSMGTGIRVERCSGDRCFDVGFDSEGGDNVVFEECRGRDAEHGVLATFFLNRRTTFLRCEASQPAGKPVFRLYNASQSQENRDVSVVECVFTGEGGISTFDNANGPVASLVVQGCRFRNVRLDLATAINMLRIDIVDNTLVFDLPVNEPVALMAVGGAAFTGGEQGLVTISGNGLDVRQVQPEGTRGIVVTQADHNGAPHTRIISNRITGEQLQTDIVYVAKDPNIGLPSSVEIRDNRCRRISILTRSDQREAYAARIVVTGNRSPAGSVALVRRDAISAEAIRRQPYLVAGD